MKHYKELINEISKADRLKYDKTAKEITAKWTKKRPTRTYHTLSHYKVKDEQYFNYVAIDGGKFDIPDFNELVKTLIFMRQKGFFFHSLVPQIQNNTIFYCDIDYMHPEDNIEDVISHIINSLSKEYDEEFLENYIVTKSQNHRKYHFYMPNIIIKQDRLKFIWHDINAECKKNGIKGLKSSKSGLTNLPIDTNCNNGLRLDGFYKYDPDKLRYEVGTQYVPFIKKTNGVISSDFVLDRHFYESTNLLVHDNTECSPRLNRKKKPMDDENEMKDNSDSSNHNSTSSTTFNSHNNSNNHSSQFSDNSTSNNSLFLDSSLNNSSSFDTSTSLNNSSSFSQLNEDIMNVSFYGQQAVEYLKDKYNFLLPHLFGHDITKIDIKRLGASNETILIQCGKNNKDKYCPIQNKQHKKNNVYYVWRKSLQLLQLRCHNDECKGEYRNIYQHQQPSQQRIDNYYSQSMNNNNDDDDEIFDLGDDSDDGELWTDIDLSELFLELNRDIIFTTQFKHRKKDDGSFFHYNKTTGLWEADKGSHKLKRMLSTKFKRQIKRKWNQKIHNATNETTQKLLRAQRNLLVKKLGDFGKNKYILEALKTLCIIETELDNNPWYFIANDKVMNLRTNKLVIPRKDEYITNTVKASWDITEFDAEKNKYIDEMIFKRLFPDANERKTILIYLSTILNGKTLKKFCVNLGMSFIFIKTLCIIQYCYI